MKRLIVLSVLSVSLAGNGVATTAVVSPRNAARWNARAAARYLDERQSWWESWDRSRRDHGTACLSCHTAVPYAIARPELRAILHESDEAAPERKLIADVVTRVQAWKEVKPFYGDTTATGREKAIQSRGTEAVLNALVLASRDRRSGVATPESRLAFANMFALQQTSGDAAGTWHWLNFGLRPWESASSVYFGAALAAVAIGLEPQNYAQTPAIRPNLEQLRTYLRSHFDQPLWNRLLLRDDPNLFNRAMLLWASAYLPGLLSADERHSIRTALYSAQSPDGSWRLSSLGRWHRARSVSGDSGGDGYATGLITYALEQGGTPPSEPNVARALTWLALHQDTAGMWSASSLNKRRDSATNVGKFMNDAATAYAVLALTATEQWSASGVGEPRDRNAARR